MTIYKQRYGKGFTLVELLVAMTITTIIVGILVSVTSVALDTWNRSRAELRAARQGKAMIETMARDFESLVIRRGNNFEWLHASFKPTTAGPNASPNAAELAFFSAVTDRYNGAPASGDYGDVSTIAYQLEYSDPFDSNTSDVETFILYRKILDPNATFNNTLGTPPAALNANSALLNAVDQPTAQISDQENFVCENVYQYTVTFEVEAVNGSGVSVRVPIQIGTGAGTVDQFRITGLKNEYNANAGFNFPNGVTQAQIESGRLVGINISMTVLSDAGIRQMRKRSFSNDADKSQFIAENSYQYSKRVLVPGS